MHPIQRLHELGQSVWLDFVDHRLVTSGVLARMIAEDGLRGLTSNPTIFQKAIASSAEYDDFIRAAPANEPDASVLERLEARDVRLACDALASTYDESCGCDGFASIEVSPAVARDSRTTEVEARRLWAAVGRPNVMVKIPGTSAGLRAIETCLGEGLNINVTLLFSVARYVQVVETYLRAIEARIARGEPVDRVASVASFFVSRIDTKVDALLDELTGSKHECGRAERGQTAIANAKLAFEEYERHFSGERWELLAAKGARPQRVLWASTSTKDPAYPDLYYAEALVGPGTVDTMTEQTFRAYLDHGHPEVRVTAGRDRAREHMRGLSSLDIDFVRVTNELEEEGVRSFADSFHSAVATIGSKRRALRSA